MKFLFFLYTLPLSILLLPAPAVHGKAADAATIKEWFFTSIEPRDDTDSPAVWHGPHGEHWVLATTKGTHSILVNDAENGAPLRRVGGLGDMPGQFNRPNGIWIIDHLMLVVERDNHRVQVLSLPSFTPLTTLGQDDLRRPYGLYVRKIEPMLYHVYVTDNYETEFGEKPPVADLGKRVVQFELEVEGTMPGTAEGEAIAAFGDTSGAGVLNIVESIFGDPAHDRLLIADEEESDAGKNIKIYTLDGRFTGQTIGDGVFEGQPEGIALMETTGTGGYWIAADQGKQLNQFHVFDRETLDYRGAFKGETTLNTDGIWITSQPMSRFPNGAFYAIQNDSAVAAFSWDEIAKSLGLIKPD